MLTMSPATMPWPAAPTVTAPSPVVTPALARTEPERANPFDKLQRRSHRPLGVILLSDRRAPDCHHGVADELLNGPAVPADHGTRQVDVTRERVADLLRVPVLGERREADEVDEQDRDQAALRDRTSGSGAGLVGRAAPSTGSTTWSAPPHAPQNRSAGSPRKPHAGQAASSRRPQPAQNRCPGLL